MEISAVRVIVNIDGSKNKSGYYDSVVHLIPS